MYFANMFEVHFETADVLWCSMSINDDLIENVHMNWRALAWCYRQRLPVCIGLSLFCLFIGSDSTPESLSSCRYHGNMEPPCQRACAYKHVECVRHNQTFVSQTLPSLLIVCISVWFSQIISGAGTQRFLSLNVKASWLMWISKCFCIGW